jgi:hypothetical protein
MSNPKVLFIMSDYGHDPTGTPLICLSIATSCLLAASVFDLDFQLHIL